MKISELKKQLLKKNPSLELTVKKDLAFQMAKHLEEARIIKGFTQVELAKKIGTSQSSIARLESGNSLPSLSFLKKIADAFETYLIPPKFAFMETLAAHVTTKARGGTLQDIDPDVNIPAAYIWVSQQTSFYPKSYQLTNPHAADKVFSSGALAK